MESRLEPARRRAARAKRALTGAAAIGFAGIVLLAQESHRGQSASTKATPTAVITPSGDDGSSTAPVQVQTHVS